jgi:hypothetical protein
MRIFLKEEEEEEEEVEVEEVEEDAAEHSESRKLLSSIENQSSVLHIKRPPLAALPPRSTSICSVDCSAHVCSN